MKKCILFKPSRKSGINSDLTYLGYYGINYKDLYKGDYTRLKKAKIEDVPYDQLGQVYEDCNKIFNVESVIIIMTAITNLFDN